MDKTPRKMTITAEHLAKAIAEVRACNGGMFSRNHTSICVLGQAAHDIFPAVDSLSTSHAGVQVILGDTEHHWVTPDADVTRLTELTYHFDYKDYDKVAELLPITVELRHLRSYPVRSPAVMHDYDINNDPRD